MHYNAQRSSGLGVRLDPQRGGSQFPNSSDLLIIQGVNVKAIDIGTDLNGYAPWNV
jgi:hypothetical protein